MLLQSRQRRFMLRAMKCLLSQHALPQTPAGSDQWLSNPGTHDAHEVCVHDVSASKAHMGPSSFCFGMLPMRVTAPVLGRCLIAEQSLDRPERAALVLFQKFQ